MRNRLSLYSEARKRASSKLQAPSPHDTSSKLQTPSPRNTRLQVRASAREAVAAGADDKALSNDAISTDPTRHTIDNGDKALVNQNDKAVGTKKDDDGNEVINGVNNNEGEDDENGGDDNGAD